MCKIDWRSTSLYLSHQLELLFHTGIRFGCVISQNLTKILIRMKSIVV
jgi:hypothetical protein